MLLQLAENLIIQNWFLILVSSAATLGIWWEEWRWKRTGIPPIVTDQARVRTTRKQ